MKSIVSVKNSVPFVTLFILFALLFKSLFYPSHASINSSMVDENMPSFSLPYLNDTSRSFTKNNLIGHVSIVNVWASWCSACKVEHPLLMKISKEYHVPVYGILYKDDSSDALRYLTRRGNPYTIIGNDEDGDTGTDLGIFGTPETFIVNPQGKIIYRYIGAMTEGVWKSKIYPMIKKYSK